MLNLSSDLWDFMKPKSWDWSLWFRLSVRTGLVPAQFLTSVFLLRRMKLEKELVAQLWRVYWEDIQISNLDKVLRSGSRITLSLVRTCSMLFCSVAGSGHLFGSVVTVEHEESLKPGTREKIWFYPHRSDGSDVPQTLTPQTFDGPEGSVLCSPEDVVPMATIEQLSFDTCPSLWWLMIHSNVCWQVMKLQVCGAEPPGQLQVLLHRPADLWPPWFLQILCFVASVTVLLLLLVCVRSQLLPLSFTSEPGLTLKSEPLWVQTGSKTRLMSFCLQRGSNYGSLMTGDGNLQVFAKTGFYKVRTSEPQSA